MLTIYQGDTVAGTINLQVSNGQSSCGRPFPIPTGAVVTMYWPGGATGSVTLSSTDPNEINITGAATGTFTYTLNTVKSALLRKGSNLAVDIVVDTTDMKQYTFEELNAITVTTRANL